MRFPVTRSHPDSTPASLIADSTRSRSETERENERATLLDLIRVEITLASSPIFLNVFAKASISQIGKIGSGLYFCTSTILDWIGDMELTRNGCSCCPQTFIER